MVAHADAIRAQKSSCHPPLEITGLGKESESVVYIMNAGYRRSLREARMESGQTTGGWQTVSSGIPRTLHHGKASGSSLRSGLELDGRG